MHIQNFVMMQILQKMIVMGLILYAQRIAQIILVVSIVHLFE